ncbi:MAG: RNA polymerase sigma factor [Patescibacteria group bacterium]|nr:RNA polymerase sigma factor [Patescibacteria group bacterium]
MQTATTTFLRWRMMGEAPGRASPIMARPYEEEFLKAFDEYADALFRHASFRIKSRERARDLTQDTFLKAWDYAREGNEVREWRGFLYRVLNNLIIDEYRRIKEESLDSLLEDSPMKANALVATGSRDEKEERLDDELMIGKIRALIPKLPDAYRTAITMRYIDDLSLKEIAAALGISENVVSVRIHRAVAQLKKLCESAETIYEK